GGGAEVHYTVTIIPRVALLLACPSPSGIVGAPYSSAFVASGGTGTYSSYAISSGSLPDGLSLDAAGRIAGTPTTLGNSVVVGRVTDSSGVSAISPNCNITIGPVPSCQITLTPISREHRYFSSVANSISVLVQSGAPICQWRATSTLDWIHIRSGLSGT